MKDKTQLIVQCRRIGNTAKSTNQVIKQIMKELTEKEKQSIRVLNFIATFDGIIDNQDDIKYILKQGTYKFIAKRRQHLVSITETAYPIRIKY